MCVSAKGHLKNQFVADSFSNVHRIGFDILSSYHISPNHVLIAVLLTNVLCVVMLGSGIHHILVKTAVKVGELVLIAIIGGCQFHSVGVHCDLNLAWARLSVNLSLQLIF